MVNELVSARSVFVQEFRRSVFGPGEPEELLYDPPSRTYLCGFLSPQSHSVEDEQNDELQTGDNESSPEGIPSLINAMWPSAMGLTVHVKPGVETILVEVNVAFYVPEIAEKEPADIPVSGSALGELFGDQSVKPEMAVRPERKERKLWRRKPLQDKHTIRVSDTSQPLIKLFPSTDGPASKLQLDIRRHDYGLGRPRLLTLTIINANELKADDGWEETETATAFQPVLKLHALPGAEAEVFVEPPAGADKSGDPDFRQHTLLYRHARDFATGHGCAVSWTRTTPRHRTAMTIRTEFIPETTVRELLYDPFSDEDSAPLKAAVLKSLPAAERDDDPNAIFVMKSLAGAKSDAWIFAALDGLCLAYETWLKSRRGTIDIAVAEIRDSALATEVRATAEDNLNRLGHDVLLRMRSGIATLRRDPVAFHCFRLANEAMHEQQWMKVLQEQQRDGKPAVATTIAWRPFQLAFLIQSVNSIADPDCHVISESEKSPTERDLMDLIWFPTGGGKTEAYLGLTAYTLFYRRLRQADPDQGAGVSVITRYTLRLLTTQQFDRAARLLCAAEMLRTRGQDMRNQPVNLGNEVFRIGLWIGGDSSPNYFRDFEDSEGAVTILERLRNGEEIHGSDVRHIRVCPWCGTPIATQNMSVVDSAGRTIFDATKLQKDECYRFVIRCRGTLPKPMTAPCPFSRGLPVQIIDEEIYADPPSLLIGTVDKFAILARKAETRSLFGRGDVQHPVPDLIIQDELHLISGPLGTMVGHFETAIEALARDEAGRRPKVIGSTATIRRAGEQVLGLFNRPVRQFPPPALTAGDSFFARENTKAPGRLYVGVMAPGISGKSLLLRTCGILLQLAEELPADQRDPYWTLVGYFNSIRELAGANVLFQDDVPTFMRIFSRLRQRLGRKENVRNLSLPVELTSRCDAGDIPKILQELAQTQSSGTALDILIATNMMSVGVDIDRLGLMVVQGQPKTTAEYIQASSRVGRRYPGLVVTLFNWTRSRDRSHYERFVPYHEAFYREVEATSVTPWSSPVRDRALSAVMVTILRHLEDSLTGSPAALATADIASLRHRLQPVLDRVRAQDAGEAVDTEADFERRILKWLQWARQYVGKAKYGNCMPWNRGEEYLLRPLVSPRGERDGLEGIPNSMRTVEPETEFQLKLVKSTGKPKEPAANPAE